MLLSGMPLVIFLIAFALFLGFLPIWGAFAEEKRVDREAASPPAR